MSRTILYQFKIIKGRTNKVGQKDFSHHPPPHPLPLIRYGGYVIIRGKGSRGIAGSDVNGLNGFLGTP